MLLLLQVIGVLELWVVLHEEGTEDLGTHKIKQNKKVFLLLLLLLPPSHSKKKKEKKMKENKQIYK